MESVRPVIKVNRLPGSLSTYWCSTGVSIQEKRHIVNGFRSEEIHDHSIRFGLNHTCEKTPMTYRLER